MKDFPPNPIDKQGYILTFQDEFNGPEIDTTKWIPYYMPHWSSRLQAAPSHIFENGSLILQITKEQTPWCPEFDENVRCSSIQSGEFSGPLGSHQGLHRFNKLNVVREEQESIKCFVPLYGYFEIRAKGCLGAGNHMTWWMAGYEESPEKSAEIDIFEILGKDMKSTITKIGHGVHPWDDSSMHDEHCFDAYSMDASYFHIYGLEWTPDELLFYIDNKLVRTIAQSPKYPMVFFYQFMSKKKAGREILIHNTPIQKHLL